MESKDWANHIEATDGLSKPWLLLQWRLKLRQEQRPTLAPKTYPAQVVDLHAALMNPGEGWQGQGLSVLGVGELSLGEP